jgi:hypothetical protein
MRVRLTRRLAERLDGVDVSAHGVGDVFEVTRHEGELLVAEGWAVQMILRPRRRPVHLQKQRRAEDRIRDEWRDEHVRIIKANDKTR